MNSADANGPASNACPFQHGVGPALALHPDTVLELPLHQRMVVQPGHDESGVPELRLFYGTHEICFDDPATFGFGEQLARQSRFRAVDALQWGEGSSWPVLRELLQQLLEAGILRVAEIQALELPRGASRVADDGVRASPLPPTPARRACTWAAGDGVMRELTGRALETGWLELVVPVFRVAHMVMDADGRQVGEANVFPPAMRLDVPTRWRSCIYPGSRHRDARPMNVTALKAMRSHWPAMMTVLRTMREAYLERVPAAREGWTVGHLERLSTAVLALPSYLLMRADGPVANGQLHPALSSLFRVTDGLRMTMHQMLFVPLGEPTLLPDEPMDAARVLDYAERNFSFHSDHGVCAGPRAMIEEFLSVVIDGREPSGGWAAQTDPALLQALQCLEPALDYALRGLQVYGIVFSAWPQMTRAYEGIASALRGLADAGCAAAVADAVRFDEHVAVLHGASYLGREVWRAAREHVYADMVAQCEAALGERGPALQQRLVPASEGDGEAAAALARALQRRYGGGSVLDPHLSRLHAVTMDHLRRLRAVLREAVRAQRGLNRLLGRAEPTTPFTADDLDLHNQLQGRTARRVPFLAQALSARWGLSIQVTAATLTVTDSESSGMGPEDARASARILL